MLDHAKQQNASRSSPRARRVQKTETMGLESWKTVDQNGAV
jgi:hypothetical protein